MGVMAEQELNEKMEVAGREHIQRCLKNYAGSGVTPIPGCEQAAAVDAAIQSVISAFLIDNHTPQGMQDAANALAHAAAMMIYQQRDIDEFKAVFLRQVDYFGREFTEDSAKGRA